MNDRPAILKPAVRCGFTFTEVLFAVILLGIGFIMIAAMFPVAIQQTQLNVEESVGSAMVRAAAKTMQQIARADLIPATTAPGQPAGTPPAVYSFRDLRMQKELAEPLWRTVRGDLILSSDPRYAWIPMFARGQHPDGRPRETMRLIVLCVQARGGGGIYQMQRDLCRGGTLADPADSTTPATLEPRNIKVKLTYNSNGSSTAEITGGEYDAAGEGAFIVISDAGSKHHANGRVYRLGNRSGNNRWDLYPGWDLGSKADELDNASALMVGRARTDPTDPNSPYEGPVQDIACYTTFVKLN